MQPPNNSIKFLGTTAIGGLLFLLPLIVVGALVGQIVPIVFSIAEALGTILPSFLKTPTGLSLLVVIAILVLLLLCFGAGLIARRSFGKRLAEKFEKNLVLLFPRYTILKDQMADSIGGDQTKARMKPVIVRLNEFSRIGFETERCEGTGLVAVFLPGSPDPWAGQVVFVASERIQPLTTDFGAAVAAHEQLGRGFSKILQNDSPPAPG